MFWLANDTLAKMCVCVCVFVFLREPLFWVFNWEPTGKPLAAVLVFSYLDKPKPPGMSLFMLVGRPFFERRRDEVVWCGVQIGFTKKTQVFKARPGSPSALGPGDVPRPGPPAFQERAERWPMP